MTRLNQTEYVKTALRLPPEVHAKIHEAAEASGRSYNAEIVARLQESFAVSGAWSKEDIARFAAEAADEVVQRLISMQADEASPKPEPPTQPTRLPRKIAVEVRKKGMVIDLNDPDSLTSKKPTIRLTRTTTATKPAAPKK